MKTISFTSKTIHTTPKHTHCPNADNFKQFKLAFKHIPQDNTVHPSIYYKDVNNIFSDISNPYHFFGHISHTNYTHISSSSKAATIGFPIGNIFYDKADLQVKRKHLIFDVFSEFEYIIKTDPFEVLEKNFPYNFQDICKIPLQELIVVGSRTKKLYEEAFSAIQPLMKSCHPRKHDNHINTSLFVS